MGEKMKIGDIVYIFDFNHRVYPKDNKNFCYGPIYREHFVERQILGETSRSWLVGFRGGDVTSRCTGKYAKKDCMGLYTLKQVQEACYKHENAYKIAKLVEKVDYTTLKAIASIIGYKEDTK